jgi:hypothetical protein
MHSLTPARLEVVRDLDHFAATEARASLARAKPPGACFFLVCSVHVAFPPRRRRRARRRRSRAPRPPCPPARRPAQLVDLLKPVEKCWQCQDFMPDPSSPTFLDEVCAVRRRAHVRRRA